MTELQRDFMTNKLTHLEPILSQAHLDRVLSVIYDNVIDKNKQYGIDLFKSTLTGLNDSGFSEKMPSNYRFSTDFVDSNIMSGNSFVVAYKWILDDNLDLHFKYVTYNNSDAKMFNTTFISSINEEKANRIVGLLALNQKNKGDDEEMALTIEEIKAELQTAMNEIKNNDDTNKAEVLSKLLDVEVAIDNIDVSGLATKTDIATIVASIPGASTSDWTEKFPVTLRPWMRADSQVFMRYDRTNRVFEWSGMVHYEQQNWPQEMQDDFNQYNKFVLDIPAELQEFLTGQVYFLNYKEFGQPISIMLGKKENALMNYTDSTDNPNDMLPYASLANFKRLAYGATVYIQNTENNIQTTSYAFSFEIKVTDITI